MLLLFFVFFWFFVCVFFFLFLFVFSLFGFLCGFFCLFVCCWVFLGGGGGSRHWQIGKHSRITKTIKTTGQVRVFNVHIQSKLL